MLLLCIVYSSSFLNIYRHTNINRLSLLPHYRSTHVLRMGLLDGLKKMVGFEDNSVSVSQLIEDNDKLMARYLKRLDRINLLEPQIEKLSNEELRAKTSEFRQRVRSGIRLTTTTTDERDATDEDSDNLYAEVFAVAREAAWRVLGLRMFDSQLLGGMALADCRLAEVTTTMTTTTSYNYIIAIITMTTTDGYRRGKDISVCVASVSAQSEREEVGIHNQLQQ